ncbi:type VI secretion system baseplate subunit TssF [Burkholderia glumae]|uniref:type VI secretion system baseplate subunit TssF n=1 Tax=Burkholderia glumae TaxID=337 RepID=UPI000C27E5FB|nr:type VI secretion system baseplate subunit TssF [Burkholderia glumae]PJO21157.1 type VI secretion system baseplate subunit TssF [Burkholderia glumae AU6208]QHE13371.1 type VI secretion system baseplate subunit TssF [Burkholderia glumae AU6208]
MQAATVTLSDCFREELASLRTESVQFSEKHRELARTLGLNAREASDPQVELLLQSFAFLAARLRHQVELDKARLPNTLLSFLYPHLEAPIPSMLIARIDVKPDGTDYAKEQLLQRGRTVNALTANQLGQTVECRFQTCYDTPLLPLRIDAVALESASEYAFAGAGSSSRSVLRVRLSAAGVGTLQSKGRGPRRLRFYIDDAQPDAVALYEMIALHLESIHVLPAAPLTPGAQPLRQLPAEALRWLGMEPDEAVLSANPHTHPGYRLLQEYFAFPEKFGFFEIGRLDELDFSGVSEYFDLLLMLDMPFAPKHHFSAHSLVLNCVPLVNLFTQRIEPIALDHSEYEYRVTGDFANHRYCEIHSIRELESISSEGKPRPIAPYFAMDNFASLEGQDYFYLCRRLPATAANVAGSEMFVSFLDQQFNLGQLTDEVVGGTALCTNRRLPERLMSGSALHLEGGGPVNRIVALTKPTQHHTPPQIGSRPWSLVSQLALNHLSLDGGALALAAMKDILRLHVGPHRESGWKQIDAITELRSRSIMRHVGRDGWRGFVRGSELTVVMEPIDIGAGSVVRFCSVLREFLRGYASVNHLVEVALETRNLKGSPKQWQASAGTAIAL